MKVTTSTVGGGVEILASHDYQGIPMLVDEEGVVKAGTPLTKAGKKALNGTGAVGILLWDVDTAENPNGTVVVDGIVDYKKAKANAGITASAADLHDAIPAIYFRDNIGVQE